ncbi:shiA [Scenedesmus sp. PABB004]|nr:shiA [Scenedesmus sp. PABB004]
MAAKGAELAVGAHGGMPPPEAIPTRKLLLSLLAISLGTVIECALPRAALTVYSQLSKVLAVVFFPSGNPAVQAVSFWGLFAVGFLSRPVGAILFGHLGDTKGRGTCLLVTVLLMGIPTVLIGCLPSYATIGIAAPILLAVLRLVQGLAMGGEFGAAMVYLVELANPRYKALTGSLGYISLGSGVVLGILVVAATMAGLSEEALLAWGWRVPFLLSVITLAVAAILRYNMPESSEFTASREALEDEVAARSAAAQHAQHGAPAPAAGEADAAVAISDDVEGGAAAASGAGRHYVPVLELFRGYWAGLALHALYGTWISASFLIGYSWLPSYLVKHGGIPTRLTLWMVLSCMLLFTGMVPLAGLASDRGLPRLTTTIALALASAGAAVPMFMGFASGSLALAWVLQAALLAMSGFAMGMLPAVVAAIYPAGVRISGCNLGVNLSSTFGGVCPLIITAVQAATGSVVHGPGIVLAATGLITAVASAVLMRHCPAANKAR